MSNFEYTSERDHKPLTHHRLMGKKTYGVDYDYVEVNINNNYNDVDIDDLSDEELDKYMQVKAIYDYKNGIHAWDYDLIPKGCDFSHKCYKFMGRKLNIPFFVIYSFLPPDVEIPSFYVMCANKKAKQLFDENNLKHNIWMSERNYCRFIHFIHEMPNDLELESKLSNKKVIYKSKKQQHEEYVAKVIAGKHAK